jgi:transposase
MEKSPRKIFSKEYKEEAAKLVLEQKYTIMEAAASLGIHERNIRRWIEELRAGQKSCQKSKQGCSEQCNVNDLQKKIKRLEMEKEILKKAAAFFAKENI